MYINLVYFECYLKINGEKILKLRYEIQQIAVVLCLTYVKMLDVRSFIHNYLNIYI